MGEDASTVATPVVGAALAAAAGERERRERLWRMSETQRVAAFYRGELGLGDCLAWAGRYPQEPPRAPDGEYLFIAVNTPEWADAQPARRRPTPTSEREL